MTSRKILSAAAIEALAATDPEAAMQARWDRSASPAARRLDSYRQKAAKSVETILTHHPAGEYRDSLIADRQNWRNQRYPRQFHGGRWQDCADVRRPDERAFYVDSFDSDLGLRELGTAEDVSKREGSRTVDHSGWFTREDDYSETVSGYVLQLPARNGKPIYIPGIAESDSDGATLFPLDQYDEPLDAARAADSIAERFAEESREYDSAWQAGSRYAQLGEELKIARRRARELQGELKPLRAPFRAAIKERLQQFRNEAAQAKRERAELLERAESCGKLADAFNEGAGDSVVSA